MDAPNIGRFIGDPNQVQCKTCPAGRYAPSQGSASCSTCQDCVAKNHVRKGCGGAEPGHCVPLSISEPACDLNSCTKWYEGESAVVRITAPEPICLGSDCGSLRLELHSSIAGTSNNFRNNVSILATISGKDLVGSRSWGPRINIPSNVQKHSNGRSVFLVSAIYKGSACNGS